MAWDNLSMRTRMGGAFGVNVLLVAAIVTLALGQVADASTRSWIWTLAIVMPVFSLVCWFRLSHAIEEPIREAEFIAETVKVRMEVSPTTGQEIERVLNEIYASPPDVIEKAKRLIRG